MKNSNIFLVVMLWIGVISTTLTVSHWLFPYDDYSITVDGLELDIRRSPQWNLVKSAWSKDNRAICLKFIPQDPNRESMSWLKGDY